MDGFANAYIIVVEIHKTKECSKRRTVEKRVHKLLQRLGSVVLEDRLKSPENYTKIEWVEVGRGRKAFQSEKQITTLPFLHIENSTFFRVEGGGGEGP